MSIMIKIGNNNMNDDQIIQTALKYKDPGKDDVVVIDMSRNASQYRFFIVDTKNKVIDERLYTTHGRKSGSLAKAVSFSNVPESNKTSKGLMKTAETYHGKHGYSLRVDGLEPGINDNVRKRVIVIHPSDYVARSFVQKNGTPGRSLGCFCLDPSISKKIIDRIKNGTPIYVHA